MQQVPCNLLIDYVVSHTCQERALLLPYPIPDRQRPRAVPDIQASPQQWFVVPVLIMLSMWLFGAGFVGALMVAWAARTPLPDCPGVSTVIVDALFTTNQKPQLFHNWTNVYTRTLELPPFTPGKLIARSLVAPSVPNFSQQS